MAGARAAVRFEGLLQFQRSAQRWRGGDATAPPLVLLESRYEQMVENFATWLRPLLLPLPLQGKARDELHASLLADFRDEFTAPDGKHKHALFPGASALVGTIPPPPPNPCLTPRPVSPISRCVACAAGANLAKVGPETVARLRAMPRVAGLVSALRYGWSVESLKAASRERPPAPLGWPWGPNWWREKCAEEYWTDRVS